MGANCGKCASSVHPLITETKKVRFFNTHSNTSANKNKPFHNKKKNINNNIVFSNSKMLLSNQEIICGRFNLQVQESLGNLAFDVPNIKRIRYLKELNAESVSVFLSRANYDPNGNKMINALRFARKQCSKDMIMYIPLYLEQDMGENSFWLLLKLANIDSKFSIIIYSTLKKYDHCVDYQLLIAMLNAYFSFASIKIIKCDQSNKDSHQTCLNTLVQQINQSINTY